MDKKLKLNYKLNCGGELASFWGCVTGVFIKCAQYTHDQTKKQVRKNCETAREMLKYDYPDEYKKDLEDFANSEIESD